jgi:hypothetical protein
VTAPSAGERGTRRLELLGWLLTGLAVLYAYFVHQGMGPEPLGPRRTWYEPHGFLHDVNGLAWAFASPARSIVLLALPAAALVAAVFIASRSALARALALSAWVSVLLFGFYGTVAPPIWEFFSWRGSAVLVLTALTVGFALAAPFLARSWLRLTVSWRLLFYAPVCFAVIALIRNATGTDESLRFSVSPWPAVPVFGIEVGALFVMVWLAGVGLGTWGLAQGGVRHAAQGAVLGISAPVALVALGSGLSLLPFKADASTLGALAAACAVGIGLAAVRERLRPEALGERARHLAVGAALLAVPLVLGEVWARLDYYWTRDQRARELIDAMDRFYAREEIYPDELEDLVAAGDLDAIPEPSIGFGFLYDGRFEYRSFGTGFILEFPAPRWVQCAYTPPYEDEEEEGGAGFGGSWSCPSNPPELW